MLTLDEAITRFTALSKANRSRAESYNRGEDYELMKAKECETCANECEQVASWLTELLKRREVDDSGACISREALKKKIREYTEPSSKLSDDFSIGMTECACEILDMIDNARTLFDCRSCKNNGNERYCLDCHDYCNFVRYEARPQGEWEDVICEKGGFYHATCSNCKIRNDIPPVDFAHFCPNCGADMRGGEDK